MGVAASTYLTPDRILGDPMFAAARDTYIDSVLEFYEASPPRIELMLEGGRMLVYGIVMALWGAYREQDRATWPTIGRLKWAVGLFGVASSRQIDLIVARFAQVGHIHVAPAPRDRRARIVLPTEALIEHDRAFIRAHYAPLAMLLGRETYARPLSGDLAFLKAMRGCWMATLGSMAQEVVLPNRPILRFYAASSGMLILMKLVRLQNQCRDGWIAVDYTDFGRRFGVSRTHVRELLKAAAADGSIETNARGLLRARPQLLAALDQNIVGRISLLDRAHAAAIAQLTVSSRV